MLSRVLADAVLVFHLAFVAFAMAGGLLALRWRWIALVHLPVLAWAAFVEFSGTVCPLTPLENALRMAGGAAGYAGGFVEHYLLPMLYPDELSRTVQFALGAGLVAFNAVVYFFLWRRRKRP